MKTLSERLAWLAGIVDGEGWIQEIGSIADSLGIAYYTMPQRSTHQNRKDAFYVVFRGLGRVEAILSAILPFLVTKHTRAELVLAMIRHRRETASGRGLTRKEFRLSNDAWLMAQVATMKNLNHRGRAGGVDVAS